MTKYLVAGVKHAFGLHRPGRKLPVRPDDIFLASYPRSGDTWTRLLIADLIQPDDAVCFDNLHRLILDPDVSTKRDFDRAPRPRIIKTHSSFDPRYQRVVYVVRDPRDVAVSQYESLRRARRNDGLIPIEDFVEQFLAGGDAASRISMGDFGSWGENVGSWLAARSSYTGFLCLRYEDMLANPARALTRIAEFAELPASPERISHAVERGSIARLEQLNWRKDLPEPQIARIEAAWGDIMACLGYRLVTRDSGSALHASLIGLLATGVLR